MRHMCTNVCVRVRAYLYECLLRGPTKRNDPRLHGVTGRFEKIPMA